MGAVWLVPFLPHTDVILTLAHKRCSSAQRHQYLERSRGARASSYDEKPIERTVSLARLLKRCPLSLLRAYHSRFCICLSFTSANMVLSIVIALFGFMQHDLTMSSCESVSVDFGRALFVCRVFSQELFD